MREVTFCYTVPILLECEDVYCLQYVGFASLFWFCSVLLVAFIAVDVRVALLGVSFPFSQS